MKSFILEIPEGRKVTYYNDPYSMLESINHNLRRKPGVSDEDWNSWDFELMGTLHDTESGVRRLAILQNHGIGHKGLHSISKRSFKKIMPKIIEMFPEMTNPFIGIIEFHSFESNLKEVHFIPQ